MSITFWFYLYACFISVLAVYVPDHNCHSYFRYDTMNMGNTYIGVFTAHKSQLTSFYWEAEFSARGSIDQVDYLNPYPNNQECFKNIKRGNRGQMFVIFQNITSELPKLISFKLNGETLCTNDKYPPLSITTRVARRMTVDEIPIAFTFRKMI
ncbi:uncharacterized protein LOC27208295 [Drosophila simulans]|uniref:uncharacterized protein LOC27208295 n=1 Tax=Drosophila simulans TaxID=7240 RepID=UPI00078ADF56|nr:uncharacterized protein LOC27208295 [Drosophila simulans]KMZ03640.1 uncharacterized protein Dsimw501_GD28447 [Drosophila simulans]